MSQKGDILCESFCGTCSDAVWRSKGQSSMPQNIRHEMSRNYREVHPVLAIADTFFVCMCRSHARVTCVVSVTVTGQTRWYSNRRLRLISTSLDVYFLNCCYFMCAVTLIIVWLFYLVFSTIGLCINVR